MTQADRTVVLPGAPALSIADRGEHAGPVVLFLPGPIDSWRSYAQVLDHMPDGLRSIAVSQRGHGDSGKPAAGYRVEDFAGDVIALLDTLEIPRAVLVCHSGSCLTARRVAIDASHRVAGLVFEASPTTLHGHAGLERFVGSILSKLSDPLDPAFVRSVIADTSSSALEPDIAELLVSESAKVPVRVWREMFAALLAYDDRPELDRIMAPVLLLWGDADSVVNREMQDQLLEALERAALLVYAGLGHTPRWEDPSRFAADVAAFAREAWRR